jgi:hypothetical protein
MITGGNVNSVVLEGLVIGEVEEIFDSRVGAGLFFSLVSFRYGRSEEGGEVGTAIRVPVQVFGELIGVFKGVSYSGRMVRVSGSLWERGGSLVVLAESLSFLSVVYGSITSGGL